MDKEVKRLENCLRAMKKCLKIPKVEGCICFQDSFKVLDIEINELYKKIDKLPESEHRGKIVRLKKEIQEIKKIISKDDKECLGCTPCIASIVFKNYPDRLNSLYLNKGL